MIIKKKIIYLLSIFSLMSMGWGCIDAVEVELWGECYNIDETTVIELSNNGLTGEIPPEIGNLTNLTYLDLQMNQLSGQIPSEIGNLINLITLRLNENNLSSEIPENICDLTIDWSGMWSEYYQIPYFNVENNNLCPPFPECLTEEDVGDQDTSECFRY